MPFEADNPGTDARSSANPAYAFPSLTPPDSWDAPGHGMTLRDYFAAKIAAALCATPKGTFSSISSIAHAAYAIADGMMIEREQGK